MRAHPHQGAKLAIMADASQDRVGAAQQTQARPATARELLAFYPKKLDQAQAPRLCFRYPALPLHFGCTDNIVADMLSRPPLATKAPVATVAAVPQALDYAVIAETQRKE